MTNSTVIPADSADQRPGWRGWLIRSLAGFALGLGCNGAVQACWLGLLVALYGSLDTALKDMRHSLGVEVGFAAYFASSPASFFGAFVAPLFLGARTRRRRAVVLSSVVGAGLATLVALLLGACAGWLAWQVGARSTAFVWIALFFGMGAGACGGWLGGRMLR